MWTPRYSDVCSETMSQLTKCSYTTCVYSEHNCTCQHVLLTGSPHRSYYYKAKLIKQMQKQHGANNKMYMQICPAEIQCAALWMCVSTHNQYHSPNLIHRNPTTVTFHSRWLSWGSCSTCEMFICATCVSYQFYFPTCVLCSTLYQVRHLIVIFAFKLTNLLPLETKYRM